MKKMGAALAAMMMLVSMAACGGSEEVDNGVDTGVVISRSKRSVTIMEDDGEKDKHSVSKSVSRRCSVGKRWPDCKR